MVRSKSRRFWIYLGSSGYASIHRGDCGQCNDGGGLNPDGRIAQDWRGCYTRGMVIDVATMMGLRLNEHSCVTWE